MGNQKLLDPIDFHSMKKNNYGSQWGPENVWLPTIFFCVQQKKTTQTGLEELEGE